MSTPENLRQVFEDDSIDLIALLKQVYQSRKLILLSAFVSAILGVIVALATPNTYISGTAFIPQSSNDSKSSSGLSGLASMAGINLGGAISSSDIPPILYPKIINSVPYKHDLLDSELISNKNAKTIRKYLSQKRQSIFKVILSKVFELPSVLFPSPEIETHDLSNISLLEINPEDKKLFELLNKNLNITFNDKQGLVRLTYSDEDKFVAAQITQRAKELLQERIIAFKNQSAREHLDFTTKQYQENKVSYEALQDSIAIFKDQNLNISSSLYQNRLDRLERELNIASSVVEQLASQVEQAKLQVNKDTPVFTIIEPVTVPFERSAPKRSLIVVIWTFLGVVLSTGFVLVKDPAKEIIASIRE